MNGYFVIKAIQELSDNTFRGTVIGNGLDDINWNGMTPIADDVITAKAEEIKSREEHIVPRLKSYPPIDEQLDMMYHDQVNDTTTWKDAIQAVKDANPKA